MAIFMFSIILSLVFIRLWLGGEANDMFYVSRQYRFLTPYHHKALN